MNTDDTTMSRGIAGTVMITGIGRGIGRALADKFLQEGYAVIGTTQSGAAPVSTEGADPADVTGYRPGYPHPHLTILRLDLSEPEAIRKCAEEVAAICTTRGGKIDILINNAGIILDDAHTVLDADLLRKTLEVNLVGTADLTERLLPQIDPGGHILFVSSSAGSISETDHHTHSHHPNQYPAYKISKAALNMYMRTLAMRLATEGSGIVVSSVHPGWVRTDMGGADAPIMPGDAAYHIFALAISRPESGYFWWDGKKYPW